MKNHFHGIKNANDGLKIRLWKFFLTKEFRYFAKKEGIDICVSS